MHKYPQRRFPKVSLHSALTIFLAPTVFVPLFTISRTNPGIGLAPDLPFFAKVGLHLTRSYRVRKFEDHAYRITTVLLRNRTNFYCERIFWYRYYKKGFGVCLLSLHMPGPRKTSRSLHRNIKSLPICGVQRALPYAAHLLFHKAILFRTFDTIPHRPARLGNPGGRWPPRRTFHRVWHHPLRLTATSANFATTQLFNFTTTQLLYFWTIINHN